jgi:hypothetical protein
MADVSKELFAFGRSIREGAGGLARSIEERGRREFEAGKYLEEQRRYREAAPIREAQRKVATLQAEKADQELARIDAMKKQDFTLGFDIQKMGLPQYAQEDIAREIQSIVKVFDPDAEYHYKPDDPNFGRVTVGGKRLSRYDIEPYKENFVGALSMVLLGDPLVALERDAQEGEAEAQARIEAIRGDPIETAKLYREHANTQHQILQALGPLPESAYGRFQKMIESNLAKAANAEGIRVGDLTIIGSLVFRKNKDTGKWERYDKETARALKWITKKDYTAEGDEITTYHWGDTTSGIISEPVAQTVKLNRTVPLDVKEGYDRLQEQKKHFLDRLSEFGELDDEEKKGLEAILGAERAFMRKHRRHFSTTSVPAAQEGATPPPEGGGVGDSVYQSIAARFMQLPEDQRQKAFEDYTSNMNDAQRQKLEAAYMPLLEAEANQRKRGGAGGSFGEPTGVAAETGAQPATAAEQEAQQFMAAIIERKAAGRSEQEVNGLVEMFGEQFPEYLDALKQELQKVEFQMGGTGSFEGAKRLHQRIMRESGQIPAARQKSLRELLGQ